jgi:hypothetical protein
MNIRSTIWDTRTDSVSSTSLCISNTSNSLLRGSIQALGLKFLEFSFEGAKVKLPLGERILTTNI